MIEQNVVNNNFGLPNVSVSYYSLDMQKEGFINILVVAFEE